MGKNLDILIEHHLWKQLSDETFKEKSVAETLLSVIEEKRYSVFVSQNTIEISNNWAEPLKENFKSLVLKLKPIIIIPNQEINKLSEEYKKHGLLPEKGVFLKEIASSSVNNIAVFLTIDYDNFIKYETKIKIKGINQMLGYPPVEIISPVELI